MSPLSQHYAIRRLIGVALLALLLGQWTVLTHSVAHTRLTPGVAASADADADADADESWGHDAGSSFCQLVDQLLVGQAVGGEPAASPCVPPAATQAAAPATSIGPSPTAHSYHARGPPRT